MVRPPTHWLWLAALLVLAACAPPPVAAPPDATASLSAPSAATAGANAQATVPTGGASAATAAITPIPTAAPTAAHAITTVFVIMMENHNWSAIYGNPAAPYINQELLPIAAYAQRYYNPPGVHPSEPNYLWLEAGTDFGINDDSDPSANHQATHDHLVTLLDRAGISWTSYQEDIGGAECPLRSAGLYAAKHNPMVYFDDVTGANDLASAVCIAHVRPYGELAGALRQNTVARYTFITPNVCHDMHGDSACASKNVVAQGDAWLAAAVPPILSSQAYQQGGALLITWDEGAGGDGPIGMIVVSPFGKGGGYTNSIRYTHSSTLRTLEEIFGVTPLLGDAAHATDLRDLFATFP